MQDVEQEIKQKILAIGNKSLASMEAYFDGKEIESDKLNLASKMLSQTVKILHMNQLRIFTERSQALRWVRWLPDDETRDRYIKLTNPQIAPLLLEKPKQRK